MSDFNGRLSSYFELFRKILLVVQKFIQYIL